MRYVVFDVETPNHANDRMSAIGIVVVEDGTICQRFFSLVNPETYFDSFNVMLTGITPQMAAAAPNFEKLWAEICPILESGVLVAHNAPFDMAVLGKCLHAYGIPWRRVAPYLCTCRMARQCLPHLFNHKLDTLCGYFAIELQHHQADSDALAATQLLLQLSKLRDPQLYLRQYDLLQMKTLQKGGSLRGS